MEKDSEEILLHCLQPILQALACHIQMHTVCIWALCGCLPSNCTTWRCQASHVWGEKWSGWNWTNLPVATALYQSLNSRIGRNFTQILSSFTWMFISYQCIAQSARQFCTIYRVSLQDGICFWFCEGKALIETTIHLNQQRKSSSFGRSFESQKHPTTCVSVHGGGPTCQVCHIRVCS